MVSSSPRQEPKELNQRAQFLSASHSGRLRKGQGTKPQVSSVKPGRPVTMLGPPCNSCSYDLRGSVQFLVCNGLPVGTLGDDQSRDGVGCATTLRASLLFSSMTSLSLLPHLPKLSVRLPTRRLSKDGHRRARPADRTYCTTAHLLFLPRISFGNPMAIQDFKGEP